MIITPTWEKLVGSSFHLEETAGEKYLKAVKSGLALGTEKSLV